MKLTERQRELLERMAAGEWDLLEDVYPEKIIPHHAYLEHKTAPWLDNEQVPSWMISELRQGGFIEAQRFTRCILRYELTDAGRAALKGEGE